MNGETTMPAEPVTVLIRRRVKAGRELEYEARLQRLQVEARSFPGYLGVTTQRPAPSGPREYVSAVRFDSLASLQAFEASELRARYLRDAMPLVEADAVWEQLTGLEFWFSAPAGTVVPQPSRPRMALVMIAIVFTLVLVIGTAVNAVFAALPFNTPYPLRLLVTIAIEVVLMTWWVMPWITRRLAPWIYPRQKIS
ncbi:MAG: antibiotic biosynthesis monooxygenase [Ruegeria sp.]